MAWMKFFFVDKNFVIYFLVVKELKMYEIYSMYSNQVLQKKIVEFAKTA